MQRKHVLIPLSVLAFGLGVVAIAANRASAAITHRYSFTTDATDSVGSANGTLFGTNGSFAGGQLVLANTGQGSQNPGADGAYLDLPNGIVSTSAASGTNGVVTVEMWITMQQNRDWAAAFTAGISVGGEDQALCCNDDQPYIQIIPRTGDGGQGNDLRVTSNSYGGPEGFVDDQGAGNGTDLQVGRKEHVVAVFDQSANPNPTAAPYGTLTVYRNGSLMGTADIAANLNLNTFLRADNTGGDVNIWLGRSQWGDALAAASYDELRIYDTAVSAQQALANAVFGPNVTGAGAIPSIEVNKTTGAITLKNNAAQPLSLEYYTITSAGGAMSTAGWNSLDQQNYNAVDGPDVGSTAGDSPGEGWDKAGGSNANNLTELFLGSAGSVLAPSASLNLGSAYNTSVFGAADGDLVFKIGVAGGALFTAPVTYVSSGLPGDFNTDGKVNGSDFLAWQRTPGVGSLTDWRNNYGAGSAEAAVASVPEPAACGLATLSLLAALTVMRRKSL